MKALAILPRGADDKLDDAVDVRLVTHRGDVVAFTLGTLATSGEEPYAVYRNGSRLARIKPELQRELRSLLAAK
jgi:predicted transcriptional regulator